jgi:hypothetical protein
MGAASSARLLAVGSAWRLTGLDAAGRTLVGAVSRGGESERALAGILLTRAGDRSVPLIAQSIAAGSAVPELVDVLASIGTPAARAAVTDAVRAPSPEVAAAAEQRRQEWDDRGGATP